LTLYTLEALEYFRVGEMCRPRIHAHTIPSIVFESNRIFDAPESLQGLKQQVGDRRAPLGRLLSMLQQYPHDAFLIAVASAEQYRLFDLDRLERMVLRQIAEDYFVLPLELTPPEDGDG
jgi:hypothetical protein